MLTDRMRTELALIPQMLLAVTVSGTDNPDSPAFLATKLGLQNAAAEALQDVMPDKRQQIWRRVTRLHQLVMAPYANKATAYKIGLIQFFLTKALVETGYLVLPEDSEFGKAVAYIMEALEPEPGEEAIVDSARKQARKVLAQLQREGYYRGVTIGD